MADEQVMTEKIQQNAPRSHVTEWTVRNKKMSQMMPRHPEPV